MVDGGVAAQAQRIPAPGLHKGQGAAKTGFALQQLDRQPVGQVAVERLQWQAAGVQLALGGKGLGRQRALVAELAGLPFARSRTHASRDCKGFGFAAIECQVAGLQVQGRDAERHRARLAAVGKAELAAFDAGLGDLHAPWARGGIGGSAGTRSAGRGALEPALEHPAAVGAALHAGLGLGNGKTLDAHRTAIKVHLGAFQRDLVHAREAGLALLERQLRDGQWPRLQRDARGAGLAGSHGVPLHAKIAVDLAGKCGFQRAGQVRRGQRQAKALDR